MMIESTTDVAVEPTNQSVPVPEASDAPSAARDADELVAADLLIEDVSIDGMCGVY